MSSKIHTLRNFEKTIFRTEISTPLYILWKSQKGLNLSFFRPIASQKPKMKKPFFFLKGRVFSPIKWYSTNHVVAPRNVER